MKKYSYLLFSILISFQSCGQKNSTSNPVTIHNAELAYKTHNYKKAVYEFKKFWNNASPNDVEDRVFAAQKLAYFAWHFEGKIKESRVWTEKALSVEHNRSASLQAQSKFESEAKNFQKSLNLAIKAESEAKTAFEKRYAAEQYCRTVFSEALDKLKRKKPYKNSYLEKAFKKINDLAIEYPEDLDISKLQLELTLISNDFSKFFSAWKRYFQLDHSTTTSGLLGKAFSLLKQNNNVQFSEMNHAAFNNVVQALINSRLFEHVSLLVKVYNDKIEMTDEIYNAVAYNTYLKKAEQLAYKYYKGIANRKKETQKFKDQLIELEKDFWKKFHSSETKKSFSHRNFLNVTKKLFGARFTQGYVNGHYAFYCWHQVTNESKSFTQYGKSATLNVVEMDNLISKDYTGWFVDFQRVGGTANSNSIIIVRPTILQEPVQIWNVITDEKQLKEGVKKIESLQKLDIQLAHKDPYALLPGMRLTILLKNAESIRDSIKSAGYTGYELRNRFIQYLRNNFQQSTFIHEVRHSIDARIGSFKINDLEYRAKLSEVAFSDTPILTFVGSVFRPEADNTSHGKANNRLVKDVVLWMQKNSDAILGFEEGTPTILQLDKLTDSQMIQIMQSLDPLAR